MSDESSHSATYVRLSQAKQRFTTTSEVAADWRELMIPWHIMRPSIAALANNWTRGAAFRHTIGVGRELLLISRHTVDRRLSWPEHTVG